MDLYQPKGVVVCVNIDDKVQFKFLKTDRSKRDNIFNISFGIYLNEVVNDPECQKKLK